MAVHSNSVSLTWISQFRGSCAICLDSTRRAAAGGRDRRQRLLLLGQTVLKAGDLGRERHSTLGPSLCSWKGAHLRDARLKKMPRARIELATPAFSDLCGSRSHSWNKFSSIVSFSRTRDEGS